MRRFVCPSIVLAAALFGASAAAQQGGRDVAGAEVLFEEGRKLMDARSYGEACPKFEASQRLAPALGTLLNLADCYEKAGRFASAWVTFRSAVAEAQRVKRADREKLAQNRAALIEKRVSRITIAATATPGLEVKRDGVAVDPALFGSAVPVDPGPHTITATAPGKKPYTTEINVDKEGVTVPVTIPALEDGSGDAPKTPAQTETPRPTEVDVPAPPPPAATSSQKTIGYVLVGVGVVGLAAGGFFGLRASSKWSDAKTHCAGTVCDAEGVSLRDDATGASTLSTIFFVAGTALVAGGVVLFVTAPSPQGTGAIRVAPTVARDGAGVAIGGAL